MEARSRPASDGPDGDVLAAALLLVLGWGLLLAFPFVSADAVEWEGGLSWHRQCQQVTFPVVGEPRCVAKVGALGVATALVGLAAGAAALVAVRRGSARALAFAHRGAVVAGAVLASGVLVGIARHFSGLGEVPFDLAALAFAAWPAQRFGLARRDRATLTVRAVAASSAPP